MELPVLTTAEINRSFKKDIGLREFVIRRWNSIPKKKTVIHESEVNYRDSNGRTLLYFSTKNGDSDSVWQLLKAGCNPNLSDVNGNAPIHIASDGGHIDIMQLLIDVGCNINARNNLGQTALIKAVQYDDLEAVMTLCNAGANMDLTDCTGKTALSIALQDRNEEIASYLIRNGCDVNIADYLGQSSLYIAVHSSENLPMGICKTIIQAGYTFDHDKEWMSKDLYRHLTEQHKGLVSRIRRRLSFKRPVHKTNNSSLFEEHLEN